ncbi:NAD-dependent epimerase/dehydratase family protein [Shewanella baltica]|uniref:NAD-dependent epimerase/dehydratase family protein n=1 Tax=Shewanella baltica TaxID=62322 RepID=UPI003D7AB5AC
MKILITGVSGFIGSQLLKTVSARYGLDNIIVFSSQPHPDYNCIQYNEKYSILDKDVVKLSDVDVIFHAGAFTPKNRYQIDDVNGCNSNIEFTKTLFSQPFQKLKKVLYLSTLDVYGVKDIITEDSILEPSSLYAWSKVYCEKMIQSYCTHQQLQCQILRVGHVYGPGEDIYEKLLPIAIHNILNGKPIEIWGDGSEIRSYIYIDDVIEACVNAIELSDNVGVINIVGGNPISILDLVKKIAEIEGVSLNLNYHSASVIRKNYSFDNTKMKRYLLKNEIDFDVGLEAEINHVKELS